MLGTSGLSERVVSGSGSVPVLPWIPQTTAAVTLRIFELDGSISYSPEQKDELHMGDEINDMMVEKPPLKFTFLKNIGKTITADMDHGKPVKQVARGGRSRGGKWLKRAAGAVSVSGSRQNFKDNVTMSQAIKQQTHGRGRRTVRRRRIEKTVEEEEEEEEPIRNFIDEEWVREPVEKMVTENTNFRISEDDEEEEESESEDDGEEHGVGFEMANEESSGFGIANNESRWASMEMSEEEEGFEVVEEDDEMINDDYVDGNDGRNFKVEDSDSFGSGDYSD